MSDTDERAQGAVIAPASARTSGANWSGCARRWRRFGPPLYHRLVAASAGRRWLLLSCWCSGAWVSRFRGDRVPGSAARVTDARRHHRGRHPRVSLAAVQLAVASRVASVGRW
jgi:hypothetical protein